jgi:hypothetical protein
MPDSSNTSSGLQKTNPHYSGKGIPFDIPAKSLCDRYHVGAIGTTLVEPSTDDPARGKCYIGGNIVTHTMQRLTPIAAAIGLSLTTVSPGLAMSVPAFFDFQCQPLPAKGDDGLVLRERFPLTIADTPKSLYIAYHPDGSPVVCLSNPDFTEAQRIENLPIEFLESIKADPQRPNGFILASANGNGLELAIRNWGLIFKTAQPEVIDLNLGIHRGKLKPDQKVRHAFNGKRGQRIAIKLDSRAQARFTVVNSRGARVITGVATSSPAISRANFTLPADDRYQVIVASTRQDEIQRYTLSINLDQIPGNP